MGYIADYVLDAALSKFTAEANRIDICSQQPANYAEATTTYTLGRKLAIAVGSPADRSPNGRKVAVAPISDGEITGNGTATHYAITDTVNSRLLAAGDLTANQIVTDGNLFSLGGFDIGIPDSV